MCYLSRISVDSIRCIFQFLTFNDIGYWLIAQCKLDEVRLLLLDSLKGWSCNEKVQFHSQHKLYHSRDISLLSWILRNNVRCTKLHLVGDYPLNDTNTCQLLHESGQYVESLTLQCMNCINTITLAQLDELFASLPNLLSLMIMRCKFDMTLVDMIRRLNIHSITIEINDVSVCKYLLIRSLSNVVNAKFYLSTPRINHPHNLTYNEIYDQTKSLIFTHALGTLMMIPYLQYYPNLETLKNIYCGNTQDIQSIGEYCPGLKSLMLRVSTELSYSSILSLADRCQSLEKLRLYNFSISNPTVEDTVIDGSVNSHRVFTHIRSLSCVYYGPLIRLCPNVLELSVKDICRPVNIDVISQSCPLLTKLTLSCIVNEAFPDEDWCSALRQLSQHCQHLSELMVWTNTPMDTSLVLDSLFHEGHQLHRLKSLQLKSSSIPNTTWCPVEYAIMVKSAVSLEHMTIVNYPMSDVVLEFFSGCTKLRSLNLKCNTTTGSCKSILDSCPNLRELYIVVDDVSELFMNHHASLSKLTVYYPDSNNGRKRLVDVEEEMDISNRGGSFPNLQILSFTGRSFVNWLDLNTFYSVMSRCECKRLVRLELLDMDLSYDSEFMDFLLTHDNFHSLRYLKIKYAYCHTSVERVHIETSRALFKDLCTVKKGRVQVVIS